MSGKNAKNMIELKILTLGDTSGGKSSFIIKFIDDRFSFNYIATMGLDFKQKVINLNNGQSVRLRIFDTAGQERFKSISLNFIKKADGILLLYDITNRSSFESVNKWIESIHDVAEEKVTILLIGNKCDLEKERVITKEEGEAKAEQFNMPFFETSCKDGTNINESFLKLSEEVIKKNGTNIKEEGQRITSNKVNKKSKCC